ncbi:MAG: DUF21 domain-containing protein [Candidatus Omnitrophica bacterium]|nr:DUF21 domain-containing protein [Candidatus Omnitrophota bacterium]
MISLTIVFILCFFLSAFFSGAEMAFVSLNKLKLRELSDSGDPAAKMLLTIYDHPHHFLTALLIGNNVVNISATSIFTYGFKNIFGTSNEWVITLLLAPLLLIFAEMLPKDYCRIRSQAFMLSYSGILNLVSRILYYPTRIVTKTIDALLGRGPDKNIFVTEEEFRSLIEESMKSGVVSRPEKRLIDTILDFEKIQVNAIMIPLELIPKVSIDSHIGEVKDLARTTQAKMILVYEEIPSIIVGMIYVFDLLFEEDDARGLKGYLRAPIFLAQNSSIEKAFLTLQEKHQSFAVVMDQTQEVTGAVSIEKLLTA